MAGIEDVSALATESRNPDTHELDTLSVGALLTIMNAEDRSVPEAVGRAAVQIADAAPAPAAGSACSTRSSARPPSTPTRAR
jgi:N-acetylmuramic acid 6-phosphate (MurNAc-6-P) etherase